MNDLLDRAVRDALADIVEAAPAAPADPTRRSLSTAPSPRRSMFLAVAAALVALVGLGGIFAIAQRDAEPSAPAATPDPTTTPAPAVATPPPWYDTIRPLLPEGFDQIALTQLTPGQSINFIAFRSGTRQLLDLSVLVDPSQVKQTSDPITLSDEQGEFFESTSGVALQTPDDHLVSVRCGLSPMGGGAVGSVSMADSVRDYCGEGFDNLGLDADSRRDLAVSLLDAFSAETITTELGEPVRPIAAPDAVVSAAADSVGDGRAFLFGAEQHGGVLRAADLSPEIGVPATTELTVISGLWPPRAADVGSPSNRLTPIVPPGSRFYHYDDVAVALVVLDDGTGLHIATSDLDEAHLEGLGELMQTMIDAATASYPDGLPADATPVATVPPVDTAAPSTSVPGTMTEFDPAIVPDGTVLVLNASETGGLAGSLTFVLDELGYDMLEPDNSAGGVVLDESIIYANSDAGVNLIEPLVDATGVGQAQELTGAPVPGLSAAMLDDADAFVVLGRDVADAPWGFVTEPAIDSDGGVLLIVDASGDDGGIAVESAAKALQSLGVDAAVAPGTRSVEQSMFIPIGEASPWTYDLASILGIDGFETWTPSLIQEELPDAVTAVFVVGEDMNTGLPIDFLAIGDSVMLGAAGELSDRGYVVNAEVSRVMADLVPTMEELGAAGLFGDPVVIHIGNNGPFTRSDLGAVVAPLADVENVVLLNNHADRPWTEMNNRVLAEYDQPGDNIILIDWDTLADECPGDCFEADDIHLTADGQQFYADTIGDITGR